MLDQKTTQTAKALDAILGGDLMSGLAGLFEQMEWAEDEIEKAKRRHPGRADLIYHSFTLLTPTHELMGTEFVYRSHCAELLNRVAAGEDTRPATDAELSCLCADTSQVAPLNTAGAGVYFRVFTRAFPGKSAHMAANVHHYEAIEGSAIDSLEAEARRKLARADRRITEIDCPGMHHGDPVNCAAEAMLAQSRKRKPAPVAEVATAGSAEDMGVLFTLTGQEAAA